MSVGTTEVARVAQASAGFRKELGLRDLVLQQIVYVVGIVWVGAAAKLGQSHIVFWLAAMLLFYLPQAAVVIHLSRAMPLEGGLYQWTKVGLGDGIAFLVGWNLWMYAVVLISLVGLTIATNLSYAFTSPWMASHKPFITLVNCVVVGVLVGLAVLGLGVSKWLHNAGSVALVAAFAVLIALPFVQKARGALPAYHPFSIAMPTLSLLSLNIFGKLAVGALSGFEYVAVLAGECRDAGRTIARATVIAAPIIAVMFILGTSAVLAFNGPAHVDLIGPIPQALRAGLGGTGIAALVAPVAILLLTTRLIANSSIVFTGNTRMPMVAGWDDLLPRWFTRLHPRFRTPVNSILFVGAVSLAFGVAGILGVGEQEAFQLLDNAAGIFYGLTYLALFAIPLAGARRAGAAMPPVPVPLKLASMAGLLVTVLYVMLSIFPIIDVPSWWSFTAKISGVVISLNLVGVLLYLNGQRRRARKSGFAAAAGVGVLALLAPVRPVRAQVDSTVVCDSVLRDATEDTVRQIARLYVIAPRSMPEATRRLFGEVFAAHFVPPSPLRVPVFEPGPVSMRMLHRDAADESGAALRTSVLYGVYAVEMLRNELAAPRVRVPSLAPGFDSSVVGAIAAAIADTTWRRVSSTQRVLGGLELRVMTGPEDRRLRVPPVPLFSAVWPRVRVTDAEPSPANLPPVYPDEERDDGGDAQALLRVVVDRTGTPVLTTAEAIRATSPFFAMSASRAITRYRFVAASVRGCPVPQAVELPFWFSLRP